MRWQKLRPVCGSAQAIWPPTPEWPKAARRGGRAEVVAPLALAVVALDDEPAAAVGRIAGHRIGEVVARHARDVGEHRRIPQALRVVQQRLVEERHVGRGGDAAAAGHAGAAAVVGVELQQASRRRSRTGSSRMPSVRSSSSGSGGSPELTISCTSPASCGSTPSARALQAERREDAIAYHLAEIAAGRALDELGEHPVPRRRVVLERACRPASSAASRRSGAAGPRGRSTASAPSARAGSRRCAGARARGSRRPCRWSRTRGCRRRRDGPARACLR